MARRILIIGATGNFGRRIARRLALHNDATLILASRDSERAKEFAQRLRAGFPAAALESTAIDQACEDLASHIDRSGANVVIHTAGPYQGQDYRVARACIECGCHYVDLADSRDFVVNFSQLDGEAKRRDLLLVTGASTLPGLSGAVIERYKPEFATLEAIDISIAPGHRTPRGPGTVAAVLSYCGKAFDVLRDGSWQRVCGWQDWRILHYPHMRRRIGGACDVPDLALLPVLHPDLLSVRFHAALEAPWEQAALWSMAAFTRLGIVSHWSRMQGPVLRLGNLLQRFGSDVGAMHVRLRGRDARGAAMERCWFLTARDNRGPEIPAIPAVIVARKLAAGDLSDRGARSCYGLITLDEFKHEVGSPGFQYDLVRK
ncbi:MAG: saccharopine dehydrogenase NADP-binding domain-containing protein [Gammaproteobacteria bacterium]|nr:saccharopine dehydrogenase NADP-binding domain-containing protein [Gammaproteobacteria bacterium]